jgi:integrase
MFAQTAKNVVAERIEFLTAFNVYLLRRNRAAKTRVKYAAITAESIAWCDGQQLDVRDVTANDIENGFYPAWADAFELQRGHPPSPNTQRARQGVLTSFYGWMSRFDLIDKNPTLRLERIEVPQRANDWLRASEDAKLLEAPANDEERILVSFLRWTGMRLGKALSIEQADVDLARNQITVRASKTPRGRRVLPILPELRPALDRWFALLAEQGLREPTLPLLVTRNRTAWAPQHCEKLVRRVAARAGVRNGTPHQLESVSKLLGHSSTAVTEQRYAELLDSTITDEVLSALR